MTKRLYAEIAKREEMPDGTVKVWGYASTPDVDADGEIITPEAMKAALPEYLKFGAVREMHGSKAAGTAIEAEVQVDGRTWFGAHIVDSEAVKKVRAKVYKGFSIGGKVVARDKVDKSTITGIKLVEVSLVDRPANPEAVFTMFKAEQLDEGEDEVSAVEAGAVEAEVDAAPDAGAAVAKVEEVEVADETHPEKLAIAALAALVKSGEMTASEILAKVTAVEEADEPFDRGELEALHKAEMARVEQRAEEALLKIGALEADKAQLEKRVAELAAMPAVPRVRLMAISKAEDAGEIEPLVAPVLKADGGVDEVATEIKKLHRLGGQRIWG